MTLRLELLAPAGTAEAGMAAVDHGADAVYIGAPYFGARAEAGNDLSEIRHLVRHAHFYYARVYVTMNTILTNGELPRAREIVVAAYDMGVDGVIIQDVGLLELDLPPIPLIASTQMHNDSPEKVKFLEDVGFSRVILARELSLSEIAAIRRETTVELEAFVHGALCVSYSGRCYMSQVVAGRSGNRGVCAQPCRSRYSLIDGNGNEVVHRKFLLSPKDLNLVDRIPDLVAAGVTSFKIEGRLKDTDYVKNAVAAYRSAVDNVIASNPTCRRASSGRSEIAFQPDLSRTFSRGYTDHFIDGRKGKIASWNTRKSVGQAVGKVVETGRDFFRIDGPELVNGDGLCFFDREDTLVGVRVERVLGDQVYPSTMQGLAVGTQLYRNHDRAFRRALKNKTARRVIPLKIVFEQTPESIRLSALDEDGVRSCLAEPREFIPAEHAQRMREKIVTHLTRTGDTPYVVTGVNIVPEAPGFTPLSALNALRRKLLEAHTLRRLEARPALTVEHTANSIPYPQSHLTSEANVLNEMAKQFYRRHGVRTLEPAFEELDDYRGRTVMTTRYCIRHQLDACLREPGAGARLTPPLRIDDGRHCYRLEFDCEQCRMRVILETL